MSIYSNCLLTAQKSEETMFLGHSLADTLYHDNLIILLTGELGAGKTTFAQGFARGLGVTDRVQSPTYALEQRYDRFTHVDLYRLNEKQAKDFLRHSEDAKGIRLIEWAERIDWSTIGPHLHVHIEDKRNERIIRCDFLDDPVPEDDEIDAWISDVRLPMHIRKHIAKVTDVADACARFLVQSNSRLIRLQALHAAARTHDLLRFVDFKTFDGDKNFTPSDEDKNVWTAIKDRHGTPHEDAAQTFLAEHGYPEIGRIVSAHRGITPDGTVAAQTIEERILAYADKRVLYDNCVTLDERFTDFVQRYGNGVQSDLNRKWLSVMKTIEADLFPDGVPNLC